MFNLFIIISSLTLVLSCIKYTPIVYFATLFIKLFFMSMLKNIANINIAVTNGNIVFCSISNLKVIKIW